MQDITMRETGKEYRIQDMVYPFPELNEMKIRAIIVDTDDIPIKFLICSPNDILYREIQYTQELMDEIIIESEAAIQRYQDEIAMNNQEEPEKTKNDGGYHG